MVFPSDANARKISQLRIDYEAANKQAHDLATLLRDRSGGRVDDQLKAQNEQKIEKSLQQKVSLHFHNATFTEVIREIAKSHGINIVMKTREISTDGLPASRPISIDVEEITLGSALTLLLDQAGGLDYHIESEVLMITNGGESKPAVDDDVENVDNMAAKKSEIRTAVQRAFTARQSLLRAELQEMQARLEKTQQSLDMRDRIVDQIVDRRVEDLLNPELKWDDDKGPINTPGSPPSAAKGPSKPTTTQSSITELEGDWHLVFSTDNDGNHFAPSPTNLTFKGDQYTLAYQGRRIDRRVEIYPDLKEIRYFKDKSGFVQNHYVLEGDRLTIYDDTGRNEYVRGHVALPKTIPKATEEQKSRWRSGIVEILGQPSADKSRERRLVGYGVIVSPQTRMIAQVGSLEGYSFFARFDDGGVVPIRILEEGAQSWLAFEPEQALEANHHFRFSEATVGEGDEVHVWGRAATVSESPTLELFETPVRKTDRKAPARGQTVWELFRHDKLDGSLPILDANGDLLAITLVGTNELLLAVPIAELKTMFPKSFGLLTNTENSAEPASGR